MPGSRGRSWFGGQAAGESWGWALTAEVAEAGSLGLCRNGAMAPGSSVITDEPQRTVEALTCSLLTLLMDVNCAVDQSSFVFLECPRWLTAMKSVVCMYNECNCLLKFHCSKNDFEQ